jgi:hypothetical protein
MKNSSSHKTQPGRAAKKARVLEVLESSSDDQQSQHADDSSSGSSSSSSSSRPKETNTTSVAQSQSVAVPLQWPPVEWTRSFPVQKDVDHDLLAVLSNPALSLCTLREVDPTYGQECFVVSLAESHHDKIWFTTPIATDKRKKSLTCAVWGPTRLLDLFRMPLVFEVAAWASIDVHTMSSRIVLASDQEQGALLFFLPLGGNGIDDASLNTFVHGMLSQHHELISQMTMLPDNHPLLFLDHSCGGTDNEGNPTNNISHSVCAVTREYLAGAPKKHTVVPQAASDQTRLALYDSNRVFFSGHGQQSDTTPGSSDSTQGLPQTVTEHTGPCNFVVFSSNGTEHAVRAIAKIVQRLVLGMFSHAAESDGDELFRIVRDPPEETPVQLSTASNVAPVAPSPFSVIMFWDPVLVGSFENISEAHQIATRCLQKMLHSANNQSSITVPSRETFHRYGIQLAKHNRALFTPPTSHSPAATKRRIYSDTCHSFAIGYHGRKKRLEEICLSSNAHALIESFSMGMSWIDDCDLNHRAFVLFVVGPSGCGKSYVARKLEEMLLGPPFTIFKYYDATQVLHDFNSILSDIKKVFGEEQMADSTAAMRGIIVIDEVDKRDNAFDLMNKVNMHVSDPKYAGLLFIFIANSKNASKIPHYAVIDHAEKKKILIDTFMDKVANKGKGANKGNKAPPYMDNIVTRIQRIVHFGPPNKSLMQTTVKHALQKAIDSA